MLLTLTEVSEHIFPQNRIHPGLISPSTFAFMPEPIKYVGVKANGDLLLYRPIEQAPLGSGPVKSFRSVREVNLAVRHPLQRVQLSL